MKKIILCGDNIIFEYNLAGMKSFIFNVMDSIPDKSSCNEVTDKNYYGVTDTQAG